MRQRQARKGFADVAHLGAGGAQKLAANRRVEKQMAYLDARARRSVPGPNLREITAVTGQFGTVRRSGNSRLEDDLGDTANRGQRLATEAERTDGEQIVGTGELAGGVTGEGKRQVVGRDAAAIIDDANRLDAALLDFHVDPRSAGIDGIFEQLLDDAGGAFDDLARRDFVDDQRRKLVNSCHVLCLPRSVAPRGNAGCSASREVAAQEVHDAERRRRHSTLRVGTRVFTLLRARRAFSVSAPASPRPSPIFAPPRPHCRWLRRWLA